MTPEKLHLALNHIAFLGAGFALIPMLLGCVMRSKALILVGLGIVVVSGMVTPIVMNSGEEAYERYEEGPVSRYLDSAAEEVMEEHEHRAEEWVFVFYLNTLVAMITMVVFARRQTVGYVALIPAMLLSVAAVGAGVWIADAGGKIRRPDFRVDIGAAAPVGGDRERREHDDDD